MKRKTYEYDGYIWHETKEGYYAHAFYGYYGIGKRKYCTLHNYIYEKYNGLIPKGYVIHHIDENKSNNNISNLQLISRKEHMDLHRKEMSEETKEKLAYEKLGNKNPMFGKFGKKHHNAKPIIQYDLNINKIKEWDCINDAVRQLSICQSGIWCCLNGKSKISGGFIWRYA